MIYDSSSLLATKPVYAILKGILMKRAVSSQLWVEEKQYLREQSSLLPDNAVIVEIGTAQGGSAHLIINSTMSHNVSMYTYDIAPSKEAYENLRGLENVSILAKSSVEGARQWPQECAESIDFLFIDGSHTLENVFNDFISWMPYVKQGGKVALHDYDPVQRGGFAHIGVKVFIDAIINLEILDDTEHIGRIFAGRKARLVSDSEITKECYCVWKKIKQKVSDFKQLDFEQYDIAEQEDAFSGILRDLRGLRGNTVTIPSKQLDRKVLILPKSMPETIKSMSENNGLVLLDELTFFYLLWDSMINNRNRILEIAKNRNGIFKWEELIEMLDHANGICCSSIDDAFSIKSGDIGSLSRVCARELVRVNMLKNIFLSIVESPAPVALKA